MRHSSIAYEVWKVLIISLYIDVRQTYMLGCFCFNYTVCLCVIATGELTKKFENSYVIGFLLSY